MNFKPKIPACYICAVWCVL